MSKSAYIPALFFHWMTPFYECTVTPFMWRTWKRIARAAVDLTPQNGVIADVGCGPGTILRNVHDLRSDTHLQGSDIDPAIVRIAKKKSAHQRISYSVASIDSLPYADNSVDTVISSLMFHHLDKQIQISAFREIQRILKPSGRFLLFDFSRSKNWFTHITKLYAVLEPSISSQIDGQLLEIGKDFHCKERTLWTVYGCMSLHEFTFPIKE